MKGTPKNAQFTYWNKRRKGKKQSTIAKEHNITRQAVNKSIKLQERDILFRLLDTARSSGILVEWQDVERGILIGISPQLGNIPCILILDDHNEIQLFYDQTNNSNAQIKKKIYTKMQDLLKNILQININQTDSFQDIINKTTT